MKGTQKLLKAASSVALLCTVLTAVCISTVFVSAQAAEPAAHPDFSGVWRHDFRSKIDKEYYPSKLDDLSFMMPWVEQEVRRRFDSLANTGEHIPNSTMLCLPTGVPYVVMEAHYLQIIQTRDQLVFLGESDHQIRYVYLNARHPANLLPSWFGHSIGHFEADTLVIDTVGFNDKSQLDPWGTPHSEALHVIERMRLLPGKKMQTIITLEDPLAFKKPWVFSYHFDPADVETIGEYACAENNRSE